jgi:hypothetical protein
MTDADIRRLDRRFDRLQRRLPARAAATLAWLRAPSARWVRVPAGVLLVTGGVFSVLPVLGLWMLPLGVLLLAVAVAVAAWRDRRAGKRPAAAAGERRPQTPWR